MKIQTLHTIILAALLLMCSFIIVNMPNETKRFPLCDSKDYCVVAELSGETITFFDSHIKYQLRADKKGRE